MKKLIFVQKCKHIFSGNLPCWRIRLAKHHYFQWILPLVQASSVSTDPMSMSTGYRVLLWTQQRSLNTNKIQQLKYYKSHFCISFWQSQELRDGHLLFEVVMYLQKGAVIRQWQLADNCNHNINIGVGSLILLYLFQM